MGTFAAYALQTAVFLLTGYLIYKWLMASEKQPAFNRRVIMGIYAVSFAAEPLADALSRMTVPAADAAAGFGIPGLEFAAGAQTSALMWPIVLSAVYLGGVTVVAVWSVVMMLRLTMIIRAGQHIVRDGYTLVVLSDCAVAPFSWGRYVVMTRDDCNSAGGMIVSHELAHIAHRHSIDLLVAQLVCTLQWFNPAAWLLREELKSVHEFQADDNVINHGVDARQYQLLLIKKAVGIRFHSIANSLNHSNLKKRITMMYSQKTSGLRRLRGLALVPALAIAQAVTDIPAVASVLSRTSAAAIPAAAPAVNGALAESTSKVTEKEADTQALPASLTVDKRAQFPGGDESMFKFLADNIKYPPALIESGLNGKVVVRFTVKADGTLADFKVIKSLSPEADAETLRVVKSMPKWKPATSDGKAVASTYSIPVFYRLQGK